MKYSRIFSIILSALLLMLSACTQKAPDAGKIQNDKAESLFRPTASIQEVMNSIVDPNADEVWNSVATIVTKDGVEEHSPHTDEEWAAVRRHAITLVEASNLLLIEGRSIAPDGVTTSSVAAELSPADVGQGVKAHWPAFVNFAHALHNAGQQAVAAIDAKDSARLVQVGSGIDQVCEQCHKQFWYPNDKVPTAAQDLGLHPVKTAHSDLYLQLRSALL